MNPIGPTSATNVKVDHLTKAITLIENKNVTKA